MDERENNFIAPAPESEPTPVVLEYVASPKEVVSYYVSDYKLPRRDEVMRVEKIQKIEPEPTVDELLARFAEPRRPRHLWRNLLLAFCALTLTIGMGLCIAYFAGAFEKAGPVDEYFFGRSDDDERHRTPPQMPHAANDPTLKLRYSETHGEELTIQQIYERVNPSTVTVMTGLIEGGTSVGTGIIFTSDGYVLTNAHVIAGGKVCSVALPSGATYDASLVGYDFDADLAVLKVDGHDLPAAEFGDSDALTVGDPVYAIGNPLGVKLRGTLTNGIVSAINRDVDVHGVTMTLIQTNAALNNGNSGGPLINCYGQVIGVNTIKMTANDPDTATVEGLGFAIPIASTAYMINDLIRYGEIHGEVMIGVSVLTTPLVNDAGETALEVYTVEPDGPAAEAGLRPGDLLLAADGEPLASSNDLLRIRRRHEAGEVMTLRVFRAGERFDVEIVLRESAK